MITRAVRIVVCAAICLMLPVSGSAQTPASSFDELSRILRKGQEVSVTHTDGHRTRGRVYSVTPTTLNLDPLPPRLFRRRVSPPSVIESSVTTVTRKDSPNEGILIGFAAGYISATVAACAQDDGGGQCFVAVYFGGPAMGLVGSLVGGLIDAKMNRIVYRSAPRSAGGATLALAPVLSANVKGVRLHVQF